MKFSHQQEWRGRWRRNGVVDYCLLMLGAGLLLPGNAFAVAEHSLDPISVTATKTERKLSETPTAVSVVDSHAMAVKQVQSLDDILSDIPGVEFSGGPRSIGQIPVIRGMADTRIMITVDGVRQNFDSGHKGRVFLEPELLKSVEVIRGPSSALYGDALGGVIAMTTKDAADFLQPGEKLGFKLKSGYQSGNKDKLASGILFGQVEDGFFDYLLNVTYRDSDDIRQGGGDILVDSAEETLSNLQKINFRPGHHVVTLQRQYLYKLGDIPENSSVAVIPRIVVVKRETDQTIYRVAYGYDNPDNQWLSVAISAYRDDLILREKLIIDGRLDEVNFSTTGFDARNTLLFGSQRNNRLTFGMEYYVDEQKATKGGAARPSSPDAEASHLGIYAQLETTLQDWILIPGVRWDQYESESTSVTSIPGIGSKGKASNVVPRLGLVYKVNPRFNLTANYGESFRFPRFGELFLSGGHAGGEFIPNPDLKPEEGKTLEAGFRLTEEVFSLRFNTYYSEYKNFIAPDRTGVTFMLDNLDRVETYGLELEGNYWHPGSDINYTLTASMQRGDEEDENGEVSPFRTIPGDKLVLGADKYFDDFGLTLGARAKMVAKQNRVRFDSAKTPGYGLLDLYGVWEPAPSWRVDFGVDNVFDKYYERHLTGLAEMGRNFKITASYEY